MIKNQNELTRKLSETLFFRSPSENNPRWTIGHYLSFLNTLVLSRNVYFLHTSRKRVIKACQGCAMPGSWRRFFKFWEVWVWGLSRVEEMQVEREEAGLGRWSRWRRWRLRTCARRPPPAISVLQYYFGPPPATPHLKYSSTQAFNKFSRSKIAGWPKNSHWFARLVLGLQRQTGGVVEVLGGGGLVEEVGGVKECTQVSSLASLASTKAASPPATLEAWVQLGATWPGSTWPPAADKLLVKGAALAHLVRSWCCLHPSNLPTSDLATYLPTNPQHQKVDSLYFEHFPLWATLCKTDSLNIFSPHIWFDAFG